MPLPLPLQAIVKWLRAGYPSGAIPEQDYVPLFALLPRKLSDEEIHELARTLNASGPTSAIDFGVLITKLTNELPRPEDMARIREKLGTPFWEDDKGDGAFGS